MTSWSALATMTRSTGSVSSAVRRSTERRSLDADDAGQGVRAAGDVADERDVVADDDAGAPELTGLHRGDDALGLLLAERPLRDQARVAAAVDADDHAAATASSWAGRSFVRGRDPRGSDGRGCRPRRGRRQLIAARSRGAGPVEHAAARARRSRGGSWRVVAMSSTSTPGTRRPDDRARGGHPVVVVGVEPPAVQGRGRDAQAVLGLGHLRAEAVELGGERGEPVGLVAADVGDAADPRGGVGERGERGDDRASARRRRAGRCRCRRSSPLPVTVSPSRSRPTSAPIVSRISRRSVAGLSRVLRPARHAHRAARDQRRGEEGPGVGEVRLDGDVEGADLGRARRATCSARCRRRSRRRRAASRPSSRCGARSARACRRGAR